jgi:sugar phosphate isomerase/epimerase
MTADERKSSNETKNLRLACADFTFPLLPHENTFDVIAMLGFQGIDIGLFDDRSHLQPKDVLPNLRASARALSEQVTGRGLEFADIFYQASTFETVAANHPDTRERARGHELFLRMLEFTLRCNAKHMTALPGIEWDGVPYETSLKRSVEELSRRAEQAAQVGITFSVEPHTGSLVDTPEKALELVSAAPGLTLTLDYTHFTRKGVPDARVEPLLKYASHFHARGAREGRIQASLKENVIDYARIIQCLKELNYAGYVGVEYTWIDWEHSNEVDNISETILMRDHLRTLAA